MVKEYCQIHHLFYTGSKCPLCDKERIGRYADKYTRQQIATENKKQPSKESLDRLKEKFNCKK